MDCSAITTGTRILRPEVAKAHYARDEHGRYWRVERYRDGTTACSPLPRPPVGVTCFTSDDGGHTWSTFTVPGRLPAAQLLCLILAAVAIPAAWIALPGSVSLVRAAAGAGLAALALAQAGIEQLAVRDPAAARRLTWISITYLAITHHRHTHRR